LQRLKTRTPHIYTRRFESYCFLPRVNTVSYPILSKRLCYLRKKGVVYETSCV